MKSSKKIKMKKKNIRIIVDKSADEVRHRAHAYVWMNIFFKAHISLRCVVVGNTQLFVCSRSLAVRLG